MLTAVASVVIFIIAFLHDLIKSSVRLENASLESTTDLPIEAAAEDDSL